MQVNAPLMKGESKMNSAGDILMQQTTSLEGFQEIHACDLSSQMLKEKDSIKIDGRQTGFSFRKSSLGKHDNRPLQSEDLLTNRSYLVVDPKGETRGTSQPKMRHTLRSFGLNSQAGRNAEYEFDHKQLRS